MKSLKKMLQTLFCYLYKKSGRPYKIIFSKLQLSEEFCSRIWEKNKREFDTYFFYLLGEPLPVYIFPWLNQTHFVYIRYNFYFFLQKSSKQHNQTSLHLKIEIILTLQDKVFVFLQKK